MLMPCAPRPLILFGGRTSVALHHTFAIGCQPGIVVRNFGRGGGICRVDHSVRASKLGDREKNKVREGGGEREEC